MLPVNGLDKTLQRVPHSLRLLNNDQAICAGVCIDTWGQVCNNLFAPFRIVSFAPPGSFGLGLIVNHLILRKLTPRKNVLKVLVAWQTSSLALFHPQLSSNHQLRPECCGLHAFLILVVLVVTLPLGELIGQVDENLTFDPAKHQMSRSD